MKKFWNWIHDEADGRVLRLEGPIDEESFWGDSVTPQAFREELEAGSGDITVWINSPGGNVFAAAEIYTMLRDYKGTVTVKIDAIAASAASVVAMAGSKVLMSPVAMLMLHDPSTIAYGNTKDMERAINTLNEVKESIINAYAAKSGLSHSRISNLMSNETWMNAKKTVELGFADEILFDAEEPEKEEEETEEEEEKPGIHLEAQLYSTRQMGMTILNRLGVDSGKPPEKPPVDTHTEPLGPEDGKPTAPVIRMDGTTEDGSVPYLILEKQLECLK
ncbi:head maturation protease, ClpP-related [Lactonifactor longoviformis]|uniref:head maturation protease, ClpP-related n=1 Tax=Lactonifactor longoviformis TaxID=341220 RepID=UPI0036F42ECC